MPECFPSLVTPLYAIKFVISFTSWELYHNIRFVTDIDIMFIVCFFTYHNDISHILLGPYTQYPAVREAKNRG